MMTAAVSMRMLGDMDMRPIFVIARGELTIVRMEMRNGRSSKQQLRRHQNCRQSAHFSRSQRLTLGDGDSKNKALI